MASAVLLLLVIGFVASSERKATSVLLPLSAKVEGRGYEELSAAWWQWAMSQPVLPFQDPDGRFCDLGQDGPVWFLAGTDGSFDAKRKCTVPQGKHLFLPVINMLYRSPRRTAKGEPFPSCKQMQERASVNNNALVSAVVIIDGVAVPDVKQYRARTSACFNPSPGWSEGETYQEPRAASDGYWLLLAPLAPGRHVITVGANYNARGEAYGGMLQNFEYELWIGEESQLVMR